jgi:thiamine-phosphate pyrophosphorylase
VNKPRASLKGLYAVTDSRLGDSGRLLRQVQKALAGGATLVQYRDKSRDHLRRKREAAALQDLCQSHGVPLIINDDIELAMQIGAAGVHLGRDDDSITSARERLGKHALIGISCYDSLERALAAAEAGANYVAFGRFYPSSVKPQAVQAHPTLLAEARRRLDLPLVAIGGITPENGAALVNAGADLLAVIAGLFGQPDITAAARRFAEIYSNHASRAYPGRERISHP